MATTFKFGNGNWAVKEDLALAYNDENGNFKPLPFDFTRASSATRVNKDGLLETVDRGMPRIDFLDNTSGHLLLEPSRTNLVTYSQEFDGYTKYSVTVEDNFSISPDGSQNAAKLTDTDSYDTIRTDATVVSGSTYTISIFAKNPSSGKFALRAYSASGNDTRRLFNLSNLTVSGAGGDNTGLVANSDNIQDYGNGWYRCSFSYVPTSTSLELNIYPDEPANTDSNSVEVYGFQCELGSYATSYIPTEGSSVTRSAETANGAGNSTVFNDSEGVLYAEMAALANDGTLRRIAIPNSGVTGLHRIELSSTDNKVFGVTYVSPSNQAAISHTLTDVTTTFKIAYKFKANDFALWVNGVKVGTDTSGSVPTGLVKINLDNGAGGNDFYGKVKDLRVYDTALSDSELQALTSG